MLDVEMIKELRETTGLSVAEIRKALEESGGDRDKAQAILKARGTTIAEKKATRSTNQGVVESYIHATRKVGAMVEVLCETDFVARNPLFLELAHDMAMHVVAMDPRSNDELLSQPFIKDQTITIEKLIQGYVAKIGENIKLGKFIRFQI
jgi:elongation factor Ts